MDRKWMDGRIVKEDAAGFRGCSETPRDFPGTDEGIGTNLSSMKGEESHSNRPGCVGNLS